jgi:hypothetical protein
MEIASDFFISFSHHDKAWADWIAWTLNEAGYSVLYQPWHFAAGSNFVLGMNKGVGSRRTLVILSENYLKSTYTQPEWAAAFAKDPTGIDKTLIPIRVSACDTTGTLLAQIVYVDLACIVDPVLAKQRLLGGLRDMKVSEHAEFSPPRGSPPFPGKPFNFWPEGPESRISTLPPPGLRVPLSPRYVPPSLRGIQVHPTNPFILDFILDSGDSVLATRQLAEIALRLTKYFLAALTIPNEHLWVNLSPNEATHIIPDDLAQTQMGIDLLEQDYVLKQLTSTLAYPEKQCGRRYWQQVLSRTDELSLSTLGAFHKVWVLPESAKVAERGTFAIVESSRLKVLMDQDYVAQSFALNASACGQSDLSRRKAMEHGKVTTAVFEQVLLRLITDDVNFGSNFCVLRQIFASVVLATWYKQVLRRSIVADLYVDNAKTFGLGQADGTSAANIYQQYLEAYRIGVFNYIREDSVEHGNELVPRKYFSGGFSGAATRTVTAREVAPTIRLNSDSHSGRGSLFWARVNLSEVDSDLIDASSLQMDRVGGIDLTPTASIDIEVQAAGQGIQFELSPDFLERLRRTGMQQLRPAVLFVTGLNTPCLEISASTSLEDYMRQA